MKTILNGVSGENDVHYMVFVNSRPISGTLANEKLAEMVLESLSTELRPLAEIVPVTKDGKIILRG